jgi:hypothetical protein
MAACPSPAQAIREGTAALCMDTGRPCSRSSADTSGYRGSGCVTLRRRLERGRHRGRHATSISATYGTHDSRNHADSPWPSRILCAWQESNLRPCAPEAHALSPELQARGALVYSR